MRQRWFQPKVGKHTPLYAPCDKAGVGEAALQLRVEAAELACQVPRELRVRAWSLGMVVHSI